MQGLESCLLAVYFYQQSGQNIPHDLVSQDGSDMLDSPAAKQQIGLEVGYGAYTMFLWILVPNTIYNNNPMDATLSSKSIFFICVIPGWLPPK